MNSIFARYKRALLCLSFLCFFEIGGFNSLQAEYGVDVKYVSIISLIGNPEKYDGDIVQVEGYVHLQFEGNAVYLHKEDYAERLYSNSIYLDVYNMKDLDRNAVGDHYCRVEGTFHQSNGGLRSGSINKIRRLEKYELQ